MEDGRSRKPRPEVRQSYLAPTNNNLTKEGKINKTKIKQKYNLIKEETKKIITITKQMKNKEK